ncbi:MAG TPA: PDR/VanB family oxidoreductase [Burkholderiales bacterium]|nr:PDR/VanB family oxidoreductase [Burkholderiales bacterium]
MMLRLRVKAVSWEAPSILSYELRPVDGGELPAFTAGAHIDLTLPNGLVRSYSLVNPQSERHRYVIAVQKDRASRGGSKWLHENVRVGDILAVNGPRNNFALDLNAENSVFIAGGIGITPILCMIEQLRTTGREWRLLYCSRTRDETPFLDLLEKESRVQLNFDHEPGGKILDIAAVVKATPGRAHLYCCGPVPMLAAFEEATKKLPRERVHIEYFAAKEPPAVEGGFKVVLAKSGRELLVPPGKTILETLRDIGLDVPHSCTEGVCGTCETRVLEGVPDHRDVTLTEAERASNKTIMICCSGAKSEKLVLDL